MKKIMLKPLAAMTIVAFAMFGCASSNENMNTTAMDGTTMSETETMAGDADMSTTQPAMSDDMGTTTETNISYRDMFNDIENTEQYDVLELARTNDNLSTFVQLVEQAGMTEALKREGPYTLFVPTNDAFKNLTKERHAFLMDPKNKVELMRVLQAHVLPSKVSSTQFTNNQRIELADGNFIPVGVDMNGTNVTIGGASIVRSNVEASNGMVHVVDAVIDPSQFSNTNMTR